MCIRDRFGSNNKLDGYEVIERVLPSEHPARGLNEDGRVNACDGHLIDLLLGAEISLSFRDR